MPKNKRQKYERVKKLPNVTLSSFNKSILPLSYPWRHPRYDGMEKILELGCGKGEHTLAFASAHPRRLCVGVDCKSHRICVGAEQALARNLDNVQFLRAWIERIEEFFLEGSIHEIWLTFPDPHLKNQGIKRRLSSPPFLDAYARLLAPGGKVRLKTDNGLLWHYTRQAVEKWGGRVVAESHDIHEGEEINERRETNESKETDKNHAHPNSPFARHVASAYESAARSRGLTIKYMEFMLTEPDRLI